MEGMILLSVLYRGMGRLVHTGGRTAESPTPRRGPNGKDGPGRRRAGPQGPGTILSRRGRRSIPILAVRGYEVGGLGSWSPSGRRFSLPCGDSGRPRQASRWTQAVGNEAFRGSRRTSVPFASPCCGAASWPGPPTTSSLSARFLKTARNLPGRAPEVRGPLPTCVPPRVFSEFGLSRDYH